MVSPNDSPTLSVESTRAYKRKVEKAAAFLRKEGVSLPSVGLLLEPGIDARTECLEIRKEWAFPDLPHFPNREDDRASRRLALCTIGESPVLLVEGTLSLQQGFSPREVVFPVRVLAELGVDRLVCANTAVSVNAAMRPGALVLVHDHINFQGANPLVGPNVEAWGPRFPDMTAPYDSHLRETAHDAAVKRGVNLQEGVYWASLGPNGGTDAEYRMMRTLGADIVGATTVPEVIAARHTDIRVLVLSMVTASCLGDESASGSFDGGGEGEGQSRLWDVLEEVTARLATENGD